MRTAVIPAQITSVEDKIAGNFNLTQIGLMIIAVFASTAIFTLLPPQNQFILYKIPSIGIFDLICIILAWPIKGKIILNWSITLLRYNLRPKYYVFDKNDSYLREIVMDVEEVLEAEDAEEITEAEEPVANKDVVLADLIRLESLLGDPSRKVSYKVNKKGGLDVAVE